MGSDTAEPKPWKLQGLRYSRNRSVAWEGKGSSVPTAATPSVINERLPTRNRARKTTHATIELRGAWMPATRLRRAAPTALKRLPAAARPRKIAARRALPRTCRARTSRSGTRRVALMPRRLARSSPTRARFHGQAPSSAAAAWPRPVTRPPTAKPAVSSACCGTTRRRWPPE